MAYEQTEVQVEKSQGEIRKVLVAAGCTQFSFGEGVHDGRTWAAVEFVHTAHLVRIKVPLKEPTPQAISAKHTRSRNKTREQVKALMIEQEAKRIWRVLFHGLKARMISIDEGVETFLQAFMPHVVDPATDKTLWERFTPAFESGAMELGQPGLGTMEWTPRLAIEAPPDDDEITDAEIVG